MALQKAGVKGRLCKGGLPFILILATPPASAITQHRRAAMVATHMNQKKKEKSDIRIRRKIRTITISPKKRKRLCITGNNKKC
jgi:hypothetical protein